MAEAVGQVPGNAVGVALSPLPVIVPVAYALIGGDGSAARLASVTWLEANTTMVMMVLFLVLGAKVLGEGLGALG